MRFLIDSMLPPVVANSLNEAGHDAVTLAMLGAHNLPDDFLIELAAIDQRVIVTENASDLAQITTAPVLLVLKSWWPHESLATSLAAALGRWVAANPQPGNWAHWLRPELR